MKTAESHVQPPEESKDSAKIRANLNQRANLPQETMDAILNLDVLLIGMRGVFFKDF